MLDVSKVATGPVDAAPARRSALQAKELAQWIALAPFVFQGARALRDSGLLAALEAARPAGLTLEEAAARTQLPHYGTRVLLEAGLGIGLVEEAEGRYTASKVAHFLLHDAMTRVNMDFAQDVCYHGLDALGTAVREGRPAGLEHFGEWPTIYRALAELPEPARKSWFAFDHLFSDSAFPAALPHVLADAPKRLLDIGGNTGKWAEACVRADAGLHVTIMDLPGQLHDARRRLAAAGLESRIDFLEADLLDERSVVPAHFDAVWMSQFLDCFSDAQIVSILKRCLPAARAGARVYILEPFWDRQRFANAAFCLQMTSLYFTALANGNSQMYRSTTFLACVEQAGFEVERQLDGLGLVHTLLVCRARAHA